MQKGEICSKIPMGSAVQFRDANGDLSRIQKYKVHDRVPSDTPEYRHFLPKAKVSLTNYYILPGGTDSAICDTVPSKGFGQFAQWFVWQKEYPQNAYHLFDSVPNTSGF